MESFAKPALSAEYALRSGALYGAASVVGERTFAAPPSIVGEDASSFQVEDLYIGWRSGKALSIGDDALDFKVGRTQYRIGQGFLLWDGGGEGGSRGGFWSNARKAWEFAGVARFKPKNHTFEAFYLDRDEVPESKTGSTLWGLNYELALGRIEYARRELSGDVFRFAAESRWHVGLQRPCVRGAAQAPAGPLVRRGVRRRGQREHDELDRVDGAGRVRARHELEAEALLPVRVLPGR